MWQKIGGVIIVWVGLLITAALIGCTTITLPEETTELQMGTPAAAKMPTASFYKEAPQLTGRVAAAELPPVEERLPLVPLVVQPIERVGVYGGTWRMGINPSRDHAQLLRTLGYENLVRWDQRWTRVIPNVALSVEANEDATEYTFQLRQGMRWSDGHPFTADDIMFWYEDIFSQEPFASEPPPWLTAGDQPVVVEKESDYTVVFRFARPNGRFLQNLASPWGAEPTSYPRHYLEQYHPKYNPNIESLIKSAGAADWVELFQQQFGLVGDIDHPSRWDNPDLPTLNAWLPTTGYSEASATIVAERNPYYWKIDPDGNQLPYIDQLVYQVADQNKLLELALAGQLEMQIRHLRDFWPVLEAKTPQQGYRFIEAVSANANVAAISLNLTDPNPVLRDIFQNKDFRIGLSHAINRPVIIEKLLAGQSEPYQVAPRPESPFYHQQLAQQYLEYDVTLANKYLDQAGLAGRDAAGFRLGPDGQRLKFNVEIAENDIQLIKIMEFVQADWRAVGIDVQLKPETRDLLYERKAANQHNAVIATGTGGLDLFLNPRYYFPHSQESTYAIPWAYWYLNPNDPRAQKPPQIVQQQMALYNQLLATGDATQQAKLMRQILDIAAEQFYVIGMALSDSDFGLAKDNFHNVPPVMPRAWTYPHPAPTNPSQFYIDP